MKLTTIAAAATALALTAGAAGSAAAQDAGWYARADAGGTFQGEVDGRNGVKADDGWTLGAGAGYAFGNGFRAEGELTYLDSDLKGPRDGDTQTLAAFVNGYYDVQTGTKLTPFVGGGIGIGKVDVDNGLVDDDDTGFAYQLKAGLGYQVNEKLTAEVAYRYLSVTDVNLGRGAAAVDGDFTSQTVTAGIRYKLGL